MNTELKHWHETKGEDTDFYNGDKLSVYYTSAIVGQFPIPLRKIIEADLKQKCEFLSEEERFTIRGVRLLSRLGLYTRLFKEIKESDYWDTLERWVEFLRDGVLGAFRSNDDSFELADLPERYPNEPRCGFADFYKRMMHSTSNALQQTSSSLLYTKGLRLLQEHARIELIMTQLDFSMLTPSGHANGRPDRIRLCQLKNFPSPGLVHALSSTSTSCKKELMGKVARWRLPGYFYGWLDFIKQLNKTKTAQIYCVY